MSRPGRVSRRMVLRGLGTSLALPLLEAMGIRSSPAASINRIGWPLRMAFIYIPNGVHMPGWTPRTTGAGFDLPASLEPLARSRTTSLY